MDNSSRMGAMGRMEPMAPPEAMPPEAAPEASGDDLAGLVGDISAVLGQVAASLPDDKKALIGQAIELLQQVASPGTPGAGMEPGLEVADGGGPPPSGVI